MAESLFFTGILVLIILFEKTFVFIPAGNCLGYSFYSFTDDAPVFFQGRQFFFPHTLV